MEKLSSLNLRVGRQANDSCY